MTKKHKIDLKTLDYLHNKPKIIKWVKIAGNRELTSLEEYDLIFDEYDVKIRKLNLNT